VGIVLLALLACLSLDASNPLLPGVMRADSGETTYWVRAARPPTGAPAPATRTPAPRPSGDAHGIASSPAGAGWRAARPAPALPRRSSPPVVARSAPPADEEH
jgi:hypothetical protein